MRVRLVLVCLPSVVAACSSTPYAGSIGKFGDGLASFSASDEAIVQGEEADRGRLDRLLTGIGPTKTERLPACGTDPCSFRIVLPMPQDPPALTQAARVARQADLRRQIPERTMQSESTSRPEVRSSSKTPAMPAASSRSTWNDTPNGAVPDPPDVCLASKSDAMAELAQLDPGKMSGVAHGAFDQDQDGAGGRRKRPPTEDEILLVLRDYGSALKAISSAADRAAFDKAADELATTAGSLAGTAGAFAGGAGAAVGPVVTAAVKLGSFAVAEGLERRRYTALRSALIQTCVPLRTLLTAAALLVNSHRMDRRIWNTETMALARDRVNRGGADRMTALEAGQQAAAAMNTLRVDPRIAARQLVEAHDRIVVAVARGDDQDDRSLESLTEALKRVGELRRATEKPP